MLGSITCVETAEVRYGTSRWVEKVFLLESGFHDRCAGLAYMEVGCTCTDEIIIMGQDVGTYEFLPIS